MDPTMLKLATSGFFHDIGKVADPNVMEIDQDYIDRHSNVFLPTWNGRYTHVHAVYTSAFIEKFQDVLPKEFNQSGWGEGDSLIKLAAGHHDPKTPMQWIVAVADRVSSGWDRAEYDNHHAGVQPRDYQKTRLIPVFERLMKDVSDDQTGEETHAYCYPLRMQGPSSIFPVKKSDQPKNINGKQAYDSLFQEFRLALERLQHRTENIELWFEHVESLIMLFFSSVPAARAGRVVPDISLYDHMKTTAALSAALYGYHRDTGTLDIPAIRNDDMEKLLIIAGDFYGIQNFIFSDSGEAGSHRAKILRGRSFAVSLFSELASDMLCRQIGIPSICVVFNAAGKFEIIAPNTEAVKASVQQVESSINNWLMNISFGETSMGIGWIAASSGDFTHGRYGDLRERLGRIMEEKKCRKIDLNRFGGAVAGYLDTFNNNLNHPLCPFCGKRPSVSKGGDMLDASESACAICRDHIFLGKNLVNPQKNRIAILSKEAQINSSIKKLVQPIYDAYQVAFLDGGLNDLAAKGLLYRYFDISLRGEDQPASDITTRLINGYVPVYTPEDAYDDRYLHGEKTDGHYDEVIDQIQTGLPRTFEHIACTALRPRIDKDGFEGIAGLGVLKADVDNLGKLMACGLKQERITVSRLATLSRQLNNYFSVYLPDMLKSRPEYQNVYTVFAGGDDLFLIGPWNRIIDLARELKESFAQYVCHNSEIHFSAGITVHKPNTPVSHMAAKAEDSLHQAKDRGRNRLTLFGETVLWSQTDELLAIGQKLESWLQNGWINSAMLYRLNGLLDAAGKEKQVVQNRVVHLKDMDCTRWRAMLAYTVGRNVGQSLPKEQRQFEDIPEMAKIIHTDMGKWLMNLGSAFRIPLWELLYNRR
ncbi:MAG: type III-A CRISPR-associated protein Cas10/Csm1 [Desulfatirhabdiaceae bacterium]